MGKARIAEMLAVFGFFLAIGLSWLGVMPLWQGPDEPAQFAYVQYMADHRMPPIEQVVAPGKAPWQFSPSPAESLAIALTQRNRVLTNPAAWLAITPQQARGAAREVSQASWAPGGDRPGSQNYVGIYPPLYYAAIGRAESWLHVRNVFDQAFGGRLFSAGLLGLTGVLLDLLLAWLIPGARLRTTLAAATGLLFPTLGMLGGTLSNDLIADAASLAVFYLALRAISAKRFPAITAVGFGVVAGIAIWTKEEAYLGLAASVPFVLRAVWRTERGGRALAWTAAAAVTGIVIGGPWLLFTWHAYHALVPPLTYQGLGTDPRTVSWVINRQFLNGPYQKDLLVNQTLFGIDFPWWFPLSRQQWVFNVMAVILGTTLAAGMVCARRTPGFWLSVVWMAMGLAVLWVVQIQYNLATGSDFLQGRYFFFLLGPFTWFAAQALKKLSAIGIPLMLGVAAALSGLAANATLDRYYHAGLWRYVTGGVIAYGPTPLLTLSRGAAVAVALAALGLLIAAPVAGLLASRSPSALWSARRG
ncbi:MAG: DUF2142 domain-containing protein [Thermaerobacter sp.]|nr:DUF2142 domain-containing protein [Thermaerobacter sp.]